MVYINGSLWAVDGISGTLQFILKIAIVFAIVSIQGVRIKKNNFLLCILLLLFILLSTVVNGLYFDLDVGAILNIILATLFVCSIKEDKFIFYYGKVMYFISLSSLVGLALGIFGKSLLVAFPQESWHYNLNFANLFFTIVPLNMNDYVRNWGFFREPGFYAVFLVISLIYELFYLPNKRLKVIFVEISALITTFSTAGILSLLSLGCAFVFSSNNKMNRVWKKRIIYGMIITLIISVYWFTYTNSGSLMYSRVFEKIMGDRASNISYITRENGILYSLNVLKNNWLWGGGYISFLGIEVDCTLLQWFSLYGVLFGITCNFLYLTYSRNITEPKMCKLFVVIAMLVIAYSQPIESNMFVFILIQYSFSRFTHKRLTSNREVME